MIRTRLLVTSGSPHITDRVSGQREHDRDRRCGLLRGQRWRGSGGNDDVDLKPHELGGNLGEPLAASFRPPILDGNGPALEPTQLVQTPYERGDPRTLGQCGARSKIPDGPQSCGLLRLRGERPCCRRAAEQRQELAPSEVEHGLLPGTRRASLPRAGVAPEGTRRSLGGPESF